MTLSRKHLSRPFTIVSPRFLNARLPMESRGISPIFGLSQFLKQRSQFSSVDGATGFRLRFFICFNQISACSRNVMPWFERTTFSKCSTVSAPLASIISLALCFRSDAESLPGPEIGQIFSRTRCLFSWPSTSFQNRTTYQLPSS